MTDIAFIDLEIGADKYNSFVTKGYRPSSADVRFQVYWHHEDKDAATPCWREDLILLPDLRMEK